MSLRPARADPLGAEARAVASNGAARLRKVLEIGYGYPPSPYSESRNVPCIIQIELGQEEHYHKVTINMTPSGEWEIDRHDMKGIITDLEKGMSNPNKSVMNVWLVAPRYGGWWLFNPRDAAWVNQGVERAKKLTIPFRGMPLHGVVTRVEEFLLDPSLIRVEISFS